jgi:hypothetical protein
MTTNDTRAALEAAIDDYGNATAREAMNADERAALHRAITSHVAAEVARALACAGSVDEVIEAFDETSAAYGAAKRGFDLGGRERAAAAQVASIDRLRAAIAADKARAVEAATAHMRPMVNREQAAQLVARFEESTGHEMRRRIDGDRKALIDALTGGENAPARPTIDPAIRPAPDEARRLVDAHGDSIRRVERAAARRVSDATVEPVTEQMVTEPVERRPVAGWVGSGQMRRIDAGPLMAHVNGSSWSVLGWVHTGECGHTRDTGCFGVLVGPGGTVEGTAATLAAAQLAAEDALRAIAAEILRAVGS